MSFFKSIERAVHRLDHHHFKKEQARYRLELLELQQQLKAAPFPVLLVIAGVDAGGKGDCMRQLNEWMDPRYLRTFSFASHEQRERKRPALWKFWQAIPRRGRIGLYMGSWYSEPLHERIHQRLNDDQWQQSLQQINRFEKLLSDDGALIIKLWLHLDKDDQRDKIESLSADPQTAWRVTERDRQNLKSYDRFREVAAEALAATDSKHAPWTLIYGKDADFRAIEIARTLVHSLRRQLVLLPAGQDNHPVSTITEAEAAASAGKHIDCPKKTRLDALELDGHALKKHDYLDELATLQGRLSQLSRQAVDKKQSSIILLEGWDAAGKGGLIRRLVAPMDARNYRIIPVAAPSEEEARYHYLWRFWRHVPGAGQVTLFDRSWYGRVLVERVESLASKDEWQRAYEEINDFETQLAESGILLCKYWLHISPEEQWQRFKKREEVPYKRFKIGADDYRNRSHWCEYAEAVDDMLAKTDTEAGPWRLVAANSKRYARLQVLQDYCDRLEAALNGPA